MPQVAPAADQVVAGVHVVIAGFVPHDHGDRIRLDDEVPGKLPCLVGGGLGGGLVGVSDRDQVRHGVLFLSCSVVIDPGLSKAAVTYVPLRTGYAERAGHRPIPMTAG